jgi:hypothetical protein
MPRSSIPKLTRKQIGLLAYPPTRSTWECKCTKYNAGSIIDNCIWCGQVKPKSPKLLWREYSAACAKVGIEPGLFVWKIGENKQPRIKRVGSSKWENWVPPEPAKPRGNRDK